MKTIRFSEIRDRTGEHLVIHEVQFPEGRDKDWYRLTMTLSSFAHGVRRRGKTRSPIGRCHDTERGLCYVYHQPCRQRTDYEKTRDASLTHIKHGSMLEFLAHINYDRAKRRFTKPTSSRKA